MSGLSCFGNFSMGELGNVANLALNNLKALGPVKFEKLDGGGFPCVIPGFAPPQFPDFVIPPFPLFGGIPPFPLFCFLPPFPGIPALSLPGISIPIPPLPFVPPIPLPIPGFSLPFLPLLPAFDLGSLSFLCGLLNIDLPIIDPFAFLNKLLEQLNALIAALNDWLNFCKENAEVINTTQVPPEVPPAIAGPVLSPEPSSGLNSPSTGVNLSGGINVPNITDGEPQAQTETQSAQTPPNISFDNINAASDEEAENMALYLANDGQIPPDPSIINQAAALLAPLGTIGDLTESDVQTLFANNNIPSAEGFIGFGVNDMDDCLEQTNTIQEFCQCLVDNGLLADNENAKTAVFNVMKDVTANARYGTGVRDGTSADPDDTLLAGISGFDVAIALNSSGVPFGDPSTTLERITRDDISRAFFIRSTTDPLTAQKIINVLVATGIVSTVGKNSVQAVEALTPLPEPLTPTTLETALANTIPGPAIGSLKAVCIAATRGINPSTLIQIDEAKANALLQSVSQFQGTTFVERLSQMTLAEFRRIFADIPFPFPLSVFDIIPILAVVFEVDDAALSDLFSNFLTGEFNSLESLFDFISFVARTVSSQQAALQAIQSCVNVREGDFVFDDFVAVIEVTLRKFSITLPSNQDTNVDIANALKLENNFDFSDTTRILGDKEIQTAEELTFLLLATGLVAASLRQESGVVENALASIEEGATGVLSNPIRIAIQSPTRVAADIDINSINIVIRTKKVSSQGIIDVEHVILENGVASVGTTVALVLNDFQQVLEITILRINGFIEELEAIEQVDVDATFSTAITSPQPIPQNLINVTS